MWCNVTPCQFFLSLFELLFIVTIYTKICVDAYVTNFKHVLSSHGKVLSSLEGYTTTKISIGRREVKRNIFIIYNSKQTNFLPPTLQNNNERKLYERWKRASQNFFNYHFFLLKKRERRAITRRNEKNIQCRSRNSALIRFLLNYLRVFNNCDLILRVKYFASNFCWAI